jgi:multiple sugar transport system substrate-binding protein
MAPPGPDEQSIYGDLESLSPDGELVTYWHSYTGVLEEALLAMIDEFNATNPWGVVVQGEYAGPDEELQRRVADGFATGRVPDLATAPSDVVASFAAGGGTVELTPYIDSRRWGFRASDLDDFLPFVLQTGDVAGQSGMAGFPSGRSMEVLYYNGDWVRELGYDHPPTTWEEFAEMACAASDPTAGTVGFEFAPNSSVFAAMLVNRGGRLVTQDGTAFAFGDDYGLETLTFLHELVTRGCAAETTAPNGDVSGFGAGRVLFIISSTSALQRIGNAVGEGAGSNWSLTALPTILSAPVANVYGPDFAVVRTSPVRQLAAWLFVRWFADTEQQARWAHASGHLPLRASAADLLQDYFEQNQRYAIAFDLLGFAHAREPMVIGYRSCQEALADMLSAVAAGAGPEPALATAVDVCNALLTPSTSDGDG